MKVLNELRQFYPLDELLRAAEIPRSTFYYHLKALSKPDKYADVKKRISEIYHENRGRYGYRRVTLSLHREGKQINHKAVQRLMGTLSLKAAIKVKRYRSYRGEVGQTAPNVLQRDFKATRPNEKWVTDVTEFAVNGRKLYLSPVIDLFNNFSQTNVYENAEITANWHHLRFLFRGMIMLIGYVRVSTNDQNTDLQRNALNCAGCERIFEDKISGTKSDRPGLKKLLRTLSAGDTLVVWKLDRLGRSMRHLVTLIEELRQRGVNFRSLTDSIDTSTPMGRFFFHVMGALAEMERELIVERTRAGLAAARAKGRVGGRRPKLTSEQWAQIGRLLEAGESRQRIALIFDVGVSTIYRKFPANKNNKSP